MQSPEKCLTHSKCFSCQLLLLPKLLSMVIIFIFFNPSLPLTSVAPCSHILSNTFSHSPSLSLSLFCLNFPIIFYKVDYLYHFSSPQKLIKVTHQNTKCMQIWCFMTDSSLEFLSDISIFPFNIFIYISHIQLKPNLSPPNLSPSGIPLSKHNPQSMCYGS